MRLKEFWGRMKKIPTIFLRDYKLKCTPVTDDINPECQWVFDGEGIATRKIDGVNIKIEDSVVYRRIKPKTSDYSEAEYEKYHLLMDKYVSKALECYQSSYYRRIALKMPDGSPQYIPALNDGIYEAYGEGIRGNAEKVEGYHMVRIDPIDHALVVHGVPRSYRGLMGYFATHDIEGIVFHHRDGRMAKIKTKDFYHLSRP